MKKWNKTELKWQLFHANTDDNVLFQFYFTHVNRFIFQRIKTLKQLRNAETIYFRVYFSFIYVVRAALYKSI